ncbi:glycosyltransferase family 4 protein [Limnobaculum xujianqingii]|uniref:glycosyltransferase family 4 protein n=1 Tax=Limnobaculum xujianqingii TaxID=2738837 RepID=UPI001129425A|nr:glycosyltransferase [Limnobaculum xujianqingii]
MIAHIIIGLDVGGAEMSLGRLVTSRTNNKDDVVIISLTDVGHIGNELKLKGFKVYSLGLTGLLSVPIVIFKLSKLLHEINPSIVQTWMYHANFIGGVSAFLVGCKNIIWGIRCTFVPTGNKATYVIMKLGALLSYVIPKYIICVADAARKSHISYGYAKRKMMVISNGYDINQWKHNQNARGLLRNSWAINTETKVIGCVGRYHNDKGQDIFVKAVNPLVQKFSNLKFILVGRGCDKSNDELVQLINDLGLQDFFILLGEHNNVRDCLSAFDLFCMPSRSEGFPNGLAEAMAIGLPCVATDVGDSRVLGGDSVVFSEPTIESLTSSIEYVLNRPEIQLSLGATASKRIVDCYSMEKISEQYELLYEKLRKND